MTFVAYFVLLTSVGFVIFVLSGSKNKSMRDYVIATALLFANTIASLVLALAYLGVL